MWHVSVALFGVFVLQNSRVHDHASSHIHPLVDVASTSLYIFQFKRIDVQRNKKIKMFLK